MIGYPRRMSAPTPRSARRRDARAARRFAALSLLALSTLFTTTGCVTRNVRDSVVQNHLIEVDLVRRVKGFTTEKRDYEHPTIIAAARLQNILGALEIEVRDDGAMIRQPAIAREILSKAAEGLSQGLGEAGPDQMVEVRAIRKQMRLGVFHRKFLTSFLAYVDDDHLYVLLRRVDWPIPQSKENDELPHPQRNQRNMDFRVIAGEPIYFAGVQDLEIDWRHEAFRDPFQLPGSTGGERKRREVLESMPVPRDEIRRGAQGELSVDQLSPEKLRALADLEEERRAGRITETDYQRAKRDLLRSR